MSKNILLFHRKNLFSWTSFCPLFISIVLEEVIWICFSVINLQSNSVLCLIVNVFQCLYITLINGKKSLKFGKEHETCTQRRFHQMWPCNKNVCEMMWLRDAVKDANKWIDEILWKQACDYKQEQWEHFLHLFALSALLMGIRDVPFQWERLGLKILLEN